MEAQGYDAATPPADADQAEDAKGQLFAHPKEMTDAELVEVAKECYRLGIDASSRWREAATEDLEFLAGEQWDAQVKGRRDAEGRPALTINRLPQFVRQITNEQRQSKPAITVNPADATGVIRTAEVFQGVIRNIEYNSNADEAYASGGASAVITGIGYWDVCAEFESERSFEQRLSIQRVRNPMSVVMDPSTKELAGEDARWVVISNDISLSEWRAICPGREVPRNGGWAGRGDTQAQWVVKDGVRVHEYRWVAEDEDTLFDIDDASPALKLALEAAGVDTSTGAILASEVGEEFAARLAAAGLQSRPSSRRRARFAKIAGDEVVERGELAGRYLQLVRVVGTELELEGRTIYEGIIRHAKDTQRALNYFVSSEAEAIALAPKAPFIIAEGQIEDYESRWEAANQRPQAYLPYKPTSVAGVAVPPPTRVMAEANVQAITQARQRAGQDLSEVTGIYPTQYGGPAPEQSGKAILARQSQGQTTNFHFMDNLAMAIRYTGRILVDLIPKIYSGPRILRIVGEDGTQEMVPVNGADGPSGQQDGRQVVQLDAGRYDVTVSLGQSYRSRREQASAQLLELVRVNPMVGQVAPDLIVASFDIPGGDEIVDRLRKMLPPQIRPPDDDKMPPPQVLAQQVQQQGAMIQQLTQALHDAEDRVKVSQDRIDAKEQDIASKERIALIQAETELTKTAAQLNHQSAQAMLDRTADLIHKRLELDGINEAPDDESTAEEPRGPALRAQLPQPPALPAQPYGALNGIPGPGVAGPGPIANAGGPGPAAGIAGGAPGPGALGPGRGPG